MNLWQCEKEWRQSLYMVRKTEQEFKPWSAWLCSTCSFHCPSSLLFELWFSPRMSVGGICASPSLKLQALSPGFCPTNGCWKFGKGSVGLSEVYSLSSRNLSLIPSSCVRPRLLDSISLSSAKTKSFCRTDPGSWSRRGFRNIVL